MNYGNGHQRRYTPLITSGTLKSVCIYCGAPSQCRDHFRTWSSSRCPYWVPACAQCNKLIGDKTPNTIGGRCQYLLERYYKKYKKIFVVRDWEATLEGTEGWLRRCIEQERALAKTLNLRMAWLDFMAEACKDIDIYSLDPESFNAKTLEGWLSMAHRAC